MAHLFPLYRRKTTPDDVELRMNHKSQHNVHHKSDLARDLATMENKVTDLQDRLKESKKTSPKRLEELRMLKNENKTLSSNNSELEKEKKSSMKRLEGERKGFVKNLEEQTKLVRTLEAELEHKANELEDSKATANRLRDELARLRAEPASSEQADLKLVNLIYQGAVARTESRGFAQDIDAHPSTQSRPTTANRRGPKSPQVHHHRASKATKGQGRFKNDFISNAKGPIWSKLDRITDRIRTPRKGENKHTLISDNYGSHRRRRRPSEQRSRRKDPLHSFPRVQHAAPSTNFRQNTFTPNIDSPGNVSLFRDGGYGSGPMITPDQCGSHEAQS